jgi:hypothetical protein
MSQVLFTVERLGFCRLAVFARYGDDYGAHRVATCWTKRGAEDVSWRLERWYEEKQETEQFESALGPCENRIDLVSVPDNPADLDSLTSA